MQRALMRHSKADIRNVCFREMKVTAHSPKEGVL